MIGYSTITQKGQVTIPAKLRRELGLKPKQRVVIMRDNGAARLRPLPDVGSLKGSLKTRKKFDIAAMRRSAKQLVGRRYRHD